MSNDSVLTSTPPAGTTSSADHANTVTALLVPITEEAQRALGGKPHVRISQLPFRVGRESRSANPVTRFAAAIERRLRKTPQLNDLYLIEPPSQVGFHISREHFAIDRDGSDLIVIDRNSACGTCVADRLVGADSKDVRTDLRDGDLIVIGTTRSPYVYQFRLSAEQSPR